MASVYQVINLKESKGVYNGLDFDNRVFLCYTSDSSKFLVCGHNTDSLKIRKDDYNYVMRSHNYQPNSIPGKIITPTFDKNGYMIDFVLSDPDSVEVV